MKLVVSLIVGILLGAASVAVAAPLGWKKSGTSYVCTGYPNKVSCTDAWLAGGDRPVHIGSYEVAIAGRWVSVNFAKKTILRCNRRDGPSCTFSP